MEVGEKIDHKKTFKIEYMKYIQDVQRKPSTDFAWPGILRSDKNMESKGLITLFLKLPNMNKPEAIFTFLSYTLVAQENIG